MKTLIGIGITFMDIVITTDYKEKNHSHLSDINYEVGGSILNIVVNCGNSGLIYKEGNDEFSEITNRYLNHKNVDTYPIFVEKPMPIFTIINQKERYTSLTKDFEIHECTPIDFNICDEYVYGITNSPNAKLINLLTENTKTKWIVNSYIPEETKFHLLEGVIMNKEESQKYNDDPIKVLQHLNQKNINWAIITLDKDGCVYLENGIIKAVKPNTANLKSKIRTGDLFTATLIKKLYEQQTLTDSIKEAMIKVELFLSNTQ